MPPELDGLGPNSPLQFRSLSSFDCGSEAVHALRGILLGRLLTSATRLSICLVDYIISIERRQYLPHTDEPHV